MFEPEISLEIVKELPDELMDPEEKTPHINPGEVAKVGDRYIGYAPYADPKYFGTYSVVRWTWREKQRAILSVTNIIDQDRGIGKLDGVTYQETMMKTCIRKSPIPLNEEFFQNLDADVGDILDYGLRKVNGMPTEEKKNFLGLSEPGKDTAG